MSSIDALFFTEHPSHSCDGLHSFRSFDCARTSILVFAYDPHQDGATVPSSTLLVVSDLHFGWDEGTDGIGACPPSHRFASTCSDTTRVDSGSKGKEMAWSARGTATSKADLVDEAARDAAAVLHELLSAPVQSTSLKELAAVFQEQRWKSNAVLESEAEKMVAKGRKTHEALNKCQKDLHEMESNLKHVKELSRHAEGEGSRFSKREIKTIEEIIRSSKHTNELIQAIEGLYDVIPMVQDIHRRLDDYTPDQNDLVRLYTELFRLGPFRGFAFQYEVEDGGTMSTNENRGHILHKVKREFEYCWRKFNRILWGHISDYRQLAEENPSLLVQCVQCIRMQDKICEELDKAPQWKNQNKEIMRKVTMTQATEMGKEKCLAEFRSHVEVECQKALETSVTTESSVKNKLSEASQLLESLFQCYRYVEPCFPPDYELFNFFASEYNRNFCCFFTEVGSQIDSISNGDILEIIGWCMDYESGLLDLDINVRALQPSLHDVMSTFREKYLERIVASMESWILNTANRDFQKPPVVSEEGKLHSLTWVDIFQMMNDQIRIVDEIEEGGQLTCQVSNVACHGVKMYANFCKNTVDKMAGGFLEADLERTCQIANDALHCIGTLNGENRTDLPLLVHVAEELQGVKNEFVDTQNAANNFLVSLILRDILPLTEQIFSEEHISEAGSSPVPSILATLDDYWNDLQLMMLTDNFQWIIHSILLKIIAQFCTGILLAKCPKHIEVEEIHGKITAKTEADLSMLLDHFKSMGIGDVLNECKAFVHGVLELSLAETYEMFAEVYSRLQDAYGEIPITLLGKHLEVGNLHLSNTWFAADHVDLLQCLKDMQDKQKERAEAAKTLPQMFQLMNEFASSHVGQQRWGARKQRKNTLL